MKNDRSLENLFQLVHQVKRHIYRQINELEADLTPMQIRTIKIIHKTPSCTAVDIANMLNRDKAQITRLLTTLINQKFVLKTANPMDKRSQYLTLTELGLGVMVQITTLEEQLSDKMTRHLTPQEFSEFQLVIEKITNNLNDSLISK